MTPSRSILLLLFAGTAVVLGHVMFGGASAARTTVFVGGTVLTMDEAFTQAEAVAIRDGRILAVGTRAEVMRAAGDAPSVVDATGKVILPAFVDAHTHPVVGGQSLLSAYVGQVEFRTVDDVLGHMSKVAAAAKDGEVLLFRDVDLATQPFAEGAITRVHLDRVSKRHPIMLLHAGGHVASINSPMLELVGITAATQDPPGGGSLGRDEGGKPNGVVFGPAIFALMGNVPAFRDYDFMDGSVRVARGLVARGIGTVGVAGIGVATGGVGDWEIFQRLGRSRAFPLRTRIYLQGAMLPLWDEAEIVPGLGNADARIVGYKISVDGSNQARTGFQREPYLGTSSRGLEYMSEADVNDIVLALAERGVQVAMHGNGDAGIDRILAAVARARAAGAEPMRPRIEHCSIVQDDQLDRFVDLGVSGSFLIAHVRYWGRAFRDSVFGAPKAALLDRCATFERRGIPYSLHTDYPVSDVSPLEMVEIAVTRSLFRTEGEVLEATERASVEMALRGVTSVPAWQVQSEHEVGSLEAGKLADLVILAEDPRAVDPEAIGEIRVLETWIDGRRVWSGP